MRSSLIIGLAGLCAALSGCARETARLAPVAALAPAPAPARPASTNGSRGSERVGRFVRERHPQLQFCYDDVRGASAGLAGSATIALALDDHGIVRDASVEQRSWVGDGSAVEGCVLAAVRRWRFPVAEEAEASSHTFTLIFSPPSSDTHRSSSDAP